MENQIVVFHNDRKRTIKCLEDPNIFVIEGKSQYLKWSITDPPKSVEFEHGPKLVLGHSFYEKGKIIKLEKFESKETQDKAVKVTVE
jgi:hypothetical protein